MRKLARAASPLALCVFLAVFLSPTANASLSPDDPGPSISLNVLQGPVGTAVTVTGHNWPAGQPVSIFCTGCDYPGNNHDLDANGQWTFTITHSDPPDSNIGLNHAYFFANGGYGPGLSALFIVTGSPGASPSPGTAPAQSQPEAGPTFVYPQDGQTLDFGGAYMFKVNPVDQATGYLFGLFQNGTMVWENYRDEHQLSGTEYAVQPDSPGHSAFVRGPVQVWVRALVNNQWTNATIININLV